MRFCNLKTYLSTLRQLIFLHPSVFNCESDLSVFIATYTPNSLHIAGYVCLSRTLLHPFSGFNRYFGLGICLLTHPFQIKLLAWPLTYASTTIGAMIWVTSFLTSIVWVFRGCLSTGGLGSALLRLQEPNSPYPIGYFRSKVCPKHKLISLGEIWRWLNDISFALPIYSCLRLVLSAITTICRFHPRFTKLMVNLFRRGYHHW